MQLRLEAGGDQVEMQRAQIERVRLKWRVAWENKAIREFRARMRLWSNYLSDYYQKPDEFADSYPFEVRNRVILQLLLPQIPISSDNEQALSHLDQLLQKNFFPDGFIWEAVLQDRFSHEVYWYLYGRLRG